jgi:hypothetical protein
VQRTSRGGERIKIPYAYMFKDYMIKPTKHCINKEGERKREYNRGDKLVHSTQVCSYQRKSSHTINIYNSKYSKVILFKNNLKGQAPVSETQP